MNPKDSVQPLKYETLADTYDEIESTSASLEKIRIFSELLESAQPDDIPIIIALSIGKLYPDWRGQPEIGIAERMAVQVVATAASVSENEVLDQLRRTGDIGLTAEAMLQKSTQMSLLQEEASIATVYEVLDAMSKGSGQGSTREKISKLVGLISDVSPKEAKYLLRTVTGTFRLGLGTMSILDALSLAFTNSRDNRQIVEDAFNVCSDLSRIASELAHGGLEAIKKIHAEVGVPIRMMAAKKLSSAEEILEKVGGKALVEYKYDGERIQVHKKGDEVILFSRRQEIITSQYPDVVEYVQKYVKSDSVVMECECIAIDPETGRVRPFQELMRRRRKTGIEEMREEVPVSLRFFDLLFLDGEDVTSKPITERRKLLAGLIQSNDHVDISKGEVVENTEHLDRIFSEALEASHEGIIAKAIHKDSIYQAGARSWLWIKLKASYKEGMTDSVDLVIVGALFGRGKRTGVYGTILVSAYDVNSDSFPTVCKIGTGFTDDMLTELQERLEEYIIDKRHPKVISDIAADAWFTPALVIEVLGDEITVSPTHPAARGRIEEGGLAIRFPRFTGRWRDDKSPDQATSVAELIDLFEKQKIRGG